jgi:hypothetical protein
MSAPASLLDQMSGFALENVGFDVRFLGLPDNSSLFGISQLSTSCRVCRVFMRVESAGESRWQIGPSSLTAIAN